LTADDEGSFFAAVDGAGVLWFRINADGVERKQVLKSNKLIWALAKAPGRDGALLVGAGDEISLLSWRSDNAGEARTVHVSQGIGVAASAAWSSDGGRFAVGFSDGSTSVWTASKPEARPMTFRASEGYVRAVALGARGEFLITGGDDGLIKYWPLEAKAAADSVCAFVMRNLTADEWNELVSRSIDYEVTCPNLPDGRAMPVSAGGD
jgi:WD40 repeat protein